MGHREHQMILNQVYTALAEKGYSPTEQIIGYIITGDPTYITNHKGARLAIVQVDRHDLLKEIVAGFFATIP